MKPIHEAYRVAVLLGVVASASCVPPTQPPPDEWIALPRILTSEVFEDERGTTYVWTKPFRISRDLCFGYFLEARRPSWQCDPRAGCDVEASYEIEITNMYGLAQQASSESCEELFRQRRNVVEVAGDMTDPTYVSLVIKALDDFLISAEAASLSLSKDADVQDVRVIDTRIIDRTAHVNFRMISPEARGSGDSGYVLTALFDLTSLSDVRLVYRFSGDMIIRED